MDKALLNEYGIDMDKGLINCMGDEQFFATLLGMFLEDDCFLRAKRAFDEKDYHALFACVHELKGVSGNAALTGLYREAYPLVELLRTGEIDEQAVDSGFHLMEEAYQRTIAGIKATLGR